MALLQISHRCPHCRERADFVVSALSEIMSCDLSNVHPPLWETTRRGSYGDEMKTKATKGLESVCLSRCPHCYNPVMFVLLATQSRVTKTLSGERGQVVPRYEERIPSEYRIMLTYPTIEPLTPHPTWPSEIAELFNEVRRLLRENTLPAIILPHCRSVLELIVKELGAPPKKPLKQQIDYLVEHSIITQPFADWAHNLREDANALLHEGKQMATKEEVAEYVSFIELLLHVTYELPKAIEEKKQKTMQPVGTD